MPRLGSIVLFLLGFGQAIAREDSGVVAREILLRYEASFPPTSELQPLKGDSAALNGIWKVLDDQRLERSWPAAIVALGYVSHYDPPLVETLTSFALSDDSLACAKSMQRARCMPQAPLGYWLAESKLAVVEALHHQARAEIARLKPKTALDLSTLPVLTRLHQMTKPQFWDRIVWRPCKPHFVNEPDRSERLAIRSLRALFRVSEYPDQDLKAFLTSRSGEEDNKRVKKEIDRLLTRLPKQ